MRNQSRTNRETSVGFVMIDPRPLAIGARLQQFPGGLLPTLNLIKLG
jgi:hypothetical protein